MPSAEQLISTRLAAASPLPLPVELREATRKEFGHFQTNLPIRLGRELGISPRTAADRLLSNVDLSDVCSPPTVAGAGFLNLTLRPEYLAECICGLAADERLGVAPDPDPQRIVVDYSGPNVAKEMHVGHLRSSVIGDALARMLTFTGHEVIRQNHIGDWGTQFGMLIEQLLDEGIEAEGLSLQALSAAYRRAAAHFKSDPEFADRSRARVVELQQSDGRTREIWRRLVDISVSAFGEIYRQLDVQLTPADVRGESAYNPDLPVLLAELDQAGLLEESDGARIVALPGNAPLIVRKRDGGYGYSATDLAAVRYRVSRLKADRLVYVHDARQALHFEQIFAVARRAGWLPEQVPAQHVRFGSVLGENGQPLKSRGGDVVALRALLHIAVQAAVTLLAERGSAVDPELARQVGIGAVKYADLSAGRSRDYVFAVHRMVTLDGDTGPYLQYAHARLCSLLDRAGDWTGEPPNTQPTVFTDPAELHLAFVLTRFPAALSDTVASLEPHRLCGYLYRLATAFSAFYERCPVIRDDVPDSTRASRLTLCSVTRRTLATGLNLLGICTPKRM
jgi:arginyl-tRNA synthetase